MIVYFVVKDLKMKFFFHYIKKGPLNFGSISSGKVYYELVPIFIVLCEIDFVKKKQKCNFTFNVFSFIYTWLWGVLAEDTCWTLHSILPKNLLSFVQYCTYEIFGHAHPWNFFRIWKVCFLSKILSGNWR